MKIIDDTIHKLDVFQQKHPVLSFPIAVMLKVGDDQAGYQAALITYYAFLSLFPLLLVGFSVLAIVAANDPELQRRVIEATLDYFPVVGEELRRNIHTSQSQGIGLFIGLIIALYGARGIANVLQEVSNTIWQIPKKQRPGFPKNLFRSIGMIIAGGLGLITTTLIVGFVAGADWGIIGKLLVVVLALILNTLVFWLVTRLATANAVATRTLFTGAVAAACMWVLLQLGGTALVIHQLKGAGALYGIFAVVLGLLFWLYLQAQLYVYALEVNVVKHKGLWPRSLQPDTTKIPRPKIKK